MRRVLGTQFSLVLASILVPGVAAQSTYETGRSQYRNGQWQAAITTLQPHYRREQHVGRKWRTAYMVGSSLCAKPRGADLEAAQRWLRWILRNYQLSGPQRRDVSERETECRVVARPPRRYAVLETERTRTGEMLFYGAGSRSAARPIMLLANESRLRPPRPPIHLGHHQEAEQDARALAASLPAHPGGPSCRSAAPTSVQIVDRFRFLVRRTYPHWYLGRVSQHLRGFISELATIGLRIPDQYVTVILAGCQEDLPVIARTLHGLSVDPAQSPGYSVDEELVAVAVGDYAFDTADTPTIRTLRHELFHLAANHSGGLPQWLNEGGAQYFAGVTREFRANTILPTSWGDLPTLAEVLDSPYFSFDQALEQDGRSECIPMSRVMMHADVARMFVAFLDKEPDRLRQIIELFLNYDPAVLDSAESTSSRILERALGVPLATLEHEFLANSLIVRNTTSDRLFAPAAPDATTCTTGP